MATFDEIDPTLRGMLVSVFRCDLSDCTNGGVTSREANKKRFYLFAEGMRGIYTVADAMGDPDGAALLLVRRWGGTENEYLHAEPIGQRPDGSAGPMFGGHYVHCSDSRVRDVCRYPVPVHDRFEHVDD